MKLEDAIEQQIFASEYVKADIHLYYTSASIINRRNRLLKQYGLSIQQFNILRILKGMKGKPISIKRIQEKMIDKMSNASRLVDKLVKKEFVQRRLCPNDRRQAEIYITDMGTQTVEETSKLIMRDTEKLFQELQPEEAKTLNSLLEKINIS